MKLIASDYDGTLCRRGIFSPEDIQAVRKWQEKGNLFGMDTGRGYFFDVYKLPEKGFDCDFYICKTGAAIYNGAGELILSRTFDGKILLELIPMILNRGCVLIDFEFHDRHWEMLNEYNKDSDDGVTRFTVPEMISFINSNDIQIHQAGTSCKTVEEATEIAGEINERFKGILFAHQNFIHIDITACDVNKATGIYDYINYLKNNEGIEIDKKDVIPVGDNLNDLEMILEFNGVTVKSATPDVIEVARRAYSDFAELVDDNLYDLPRCIETERLLLRRFTMGDKETVAEILNNPEMSEYMLTLPFPYSEENAESWIATHDVGFLNNLMYTYAVTEKLSGKLCGSIGLSNIKEHKRGEVGYWISREFWGRGYCKETVAAIFSLAFNELKYNKITAQCFAENRQSEKVMIFSGMKQEGTLKKHYYKNGNFSDAKLYSIIWDDYNKGNI